MKLKGKCKVLRVYVDEELKWKNQLLFRAIVEQLLREGFAGATVFKGIEGFGSSSRIHSARILEVTEKLPVMVEVVDKPVRIQKALRSIEPMLPKHCLVTLQDIQVLRYYDSKVEHQK